MSVIVGIIGDLLRTNRALIEDTLEHTKKLRFGSLDPDRPVPLRLLDDPPLHATAVPLEAELRR